MWRTGFRTRAKVLSNFFKKSLNWNLRFFQIKKLKFKPRWGVLLKNKNWTTLIHLNHLITSNHLIFSTYQPMYKTYLLQNGKPRWNQISTQFRFIHNGVITFIQKGWCAGGLLLLHNGQKQSRLAWLSHLWKSWVSGMNPTHPQSLLWWLCWHTWLCDLRNLSVYQMLSSLSRYMWVLCAMAIAISSIRIWHLMY